MGRKRTIDRDAILDAAEAIVSEAGAGQLTFDQVAARAGVSKGGVLYCFASKSALIAAMMERDLRRFEAEVAARHAAGEGDRLKARIDATRDESEAMAARAASLMAALVEVGDEAEPLRADYRGWLDSFRDDAEGRRRRLAFLACEGIFMLRGLGILDIDAKEWDAIFDDIAQLANEN
ncbi:TetR family transcriptional regulator [Mesorhizobium sp. YIM 152430]|uniref:TetR/AcrR family transcriptional regulator n=1 Tax=Mesorhizobium sp. YIM 152430 TaxID=3031761 RepID=UPI0023DACDAE|nr:TetR family transcriptional regulator [Mesorhizobium sp. YIM 152430]MDF1598493.1 TetR family transcriptional regulator [Mesorhizobium sp. YIM 152430]